MRIQDWPTGEQPRAKLLANGAQSMGNTELLAVFLGSGRQGQNACQLAHQLMAKFTTFSNLFTATTEDFCAEAGVGIVRYMQLQAAREMVRRMLEEPLQREHVFTDVNQVHHYLLASFKGLEQEVFGMLLLDSQHQLIAYRPMFFGTVNSAAVYPRELVKRALKENAAAVILAHNHPSGNPEPSLADIKLTKQVIAAMALVDISVLDHFVVGEGLTVSLSQRGLM
ncbi:RadC family protein [Salinimonas sediminis]|uniref:JAB domain-containing protein n=1 Tax=Salinimonas sediminis TaxID=2303538 RepID=A0A346NRX9_9ALTE|nr:DNA repair protein RadC [Salinimonas sediminis]AXR08286.1 JAB domain-containing protein [Salinimonas sediminis]